MPIDVVPNQPWENIVKFVDLCEYLLLEAKKEADELKELFSLNLIINLSYYSTQQPPVKYLFKELDIDDSIADLQPQCLKELTFRLKTFDELKKMLKLIDDNKADPNKFTKHFNNMQLDHMLIENYGKTKVLVAKVTRYTTDIYIGLDQLDKIKNTLKELNCRVHIGNNNYDH